MMMAVFRDKDASPVEVHASSARGRHLQPGVHSLGEQV